MRAVWILVVVVPIAGCYASHERHHPAEIDAALDGGVTETEDARDASDAGDPDAGCDGCPRPCRTDVDCETATYCNRCPADPLGECQPRPPCPMSPAIPVCGCYGVDHPGVCAAIAAGDAVRNRGFCRETSAYRYGWVGRTSCGGTTGDDRGWHVVLTTEPIECPTPDPRHGWPGEPMLGVELDRELARDTFPRTYDVPSGYVHFDHGTGVVVGELSVLALDVGSVASVSYRLYGPGGPYIAGPLELPVCPWDYWPCEP